MRRSAYPMTLMSDAFVLVEEAVREIRTAYNESEDILLTSNCAVGRVLALNVNAFVDVPTRPCSRLDGYAVHAADGPGVYPVMQARRAGHAGAADADPLPRGVIAYVTTGASLPSGADAVVKIEDTEAEAITIAANGDTTCDPPGQADGMQRVRLVLPHGNVRVGEGVRNSGSDVRAGALLLPEGHVLTPLDVGTLLSARVQSVRARICARVGIISSGDELLQTSSETPSSETDADDDAIVDSNRPMLNALLSQLIGGVQVKVHDCGAVRDEMDATKVALARAALACHVLVSTGAVSMGDRDFIKPSLEFLGSVKFGRLNMKPGKPTTMAVVTAEDARDCIAALVSMEEAEAAYTARCSSKCIMFGLPGNPVSAAVCFHVLVAPALKMLMTGCTWRESAPPQVTVRLMEPAGLPLDPERPEYHRALVWWHGQEREIHGLSTGAQASSRMASTTHANALLWLPASAGRLPCGSLVPAYLLGQMYDESAPAVQVELRSRQGMGREEESAWKEQVCSCGMEHPPLAEGTRGVHPPHIIQGGIGGAGSGVGSGAEGRVVSGKAGPVPAVTLGIVTVSDSVSRGETVDSSGPAVLAALRGLVQVGVGEGSVSSPRLHITAVHTRIVPDDVKDIQEAILALCEGEAACTLVVTTGGTGLGVRDVTPEATLPLLHKRCPGLVHAMLAYGLARTPLACLSRYEAGIRITGAAMRAVTVRTGANAAFEKGAPPGPGCLIVNMPGSPKAVQECVDALSPALPHALALVGGK